MGNGTRSAGCAGSARRIAARITGCSSASPRSAISLLVGWFVVSLLLLPQPRLRRRSRDWLAEPVPATAMALLVISTFWHARLGLQVLIEDYVHEAGNKFAAITALNLAAFGGAAVRPVLRAQSPRAREAPC